jgi:DNA repair protein RadC
MDLSSLSREELVDQLLRPRLVAEERSEEPLAERLSAYPAGGPDPIAHQLGVARELLLRDLRAQMQRGPVMDSPQVLRDWLSLYCAGLEYEVFIVLFLTTQHALIEAVPIFRGTLTQTAVYPREVVKLALSHNAAAVAFAHNHQGSPEPSRADEFLTQNLRFALALVDVRVLDHFIVAGDQLVSFAERGLL